MFGQIRTLYQSFQRIERCILGLHLVEEPSQFLREKQRLLRADRVQAGILLRQFAPIRLNQV